MQIKNMEKRKKVEKTELERVQHSNHSPYLFDHD